MGASAVAMGGIGAYYSGMRAQSIFSNVSQARSGNLIDTYYPGGAAAARRNAAQLQFHNMSKQAQTGAEKERNYGPAGGLLLARGLAKKETAGIIADSRAGEIFGTHRLSNYFYGNTASSVLGFETRFNYIARILGQYRLPSDENSIYTVMSNPQVLFPAAGGMTNYTIDPKTNLPIISTAGGWQFSGSNIIRVPNFFSAQIKQSASDKLVSSVGNVIRNDDRYNLDFANNFVRSIIGHTQRSLQHKWDDEFTRRISNDASLNRVYNELTKAGVGNKGSIGITFMGTGYAVFRDNYTGKSYEVQISSQEREALERASKEAFTTALETALKTSSGREDVNKALRSMGTTEAKELADKIESIKSLENMVSGDTTPYLVNLYIQKRAEEIAKQEGIDSERLLHSEPFLNSMIQEINMMVSEGKLDQFFRKLGISLDSPENFLKTIQQIPEREELQQKAAQIKDETIQGNENIKQKVNPRTEKAEQLQGIPNYDPKFVGKPNFPKLNLTYRMDQIKEMLKNAPSWVQEDKVGVNTWAKNLLNLTPLSLIIGGVDYFVLGDKNAKFAPHEPSIKTYLIPYKQNTDLVPIGEPGGYTVTKPILDLIFKNENKGFSGGKASVQSGPKVPIINANPEFSFEGPRLIDHLLSQKDGPSFNIQQGFNK